MPSRFRRKLGRIRYAVGYWWLEQADGWHRLGHGTASRARRLVRWPRTLRTRASDALASRQGRRGALAAVTGVVVAGVVLGATRLPGEEQPVDRGALATEQGVAGAQGAGLSRPGIHLTASLQESGDLLVVERVVLPEPTDVLPLAAPPDPPGAGGATARLVDLRASADDHAVAGAGPTEAGQLDLPRPATSVVLRYRVAYAGGPGSAAPSGRVTLAIRPVASDALASEPVVVQVRGTGVRALVCADLPRGRQRCGVDTTHGWHTRPVTASRSTVLAVVAG